MNKLKLKITNLLEDQRILRIAAAHEEGLSYAYVESASHFSPDDQVLISKAFQASGYSELVAFALEALNDIPDLFRVSSQLEGIAEFDDTTALFNYALSSEDGKCFIICTVEDYYIVCGTQEFVETAVGQDLISAQQAFVDFAQTPGFSESQRLFLLGLLQK